MITMKLIKQSINDFFDNELKSLGFQNSKHTFIKDFSGYYQLINIEYSQFNFYKTEEFFNLSFHIQIGFFFPEAFQFSFSTFYDDMDLEEIEIPLNPKISDCNFRKRGHEILKMAKSYQINQDTDITTFFDQLKRELNQELIPFLNNTNSLEKSRLKINEINKNNNADVWLSLTYGKMGQHNKAIQLIESYLSDSNTKQIIKNRIYKQLKEKGVDIVQPLPSSKENIDFSKGSYP